MHSVILLSFILLLSTREESKYFEKLIWMRLVSSIFVDHTFSFLFCCCSTKFNAQWIQNIIKCFIDRIFDQKFTYPWNWFILIPRRFMSKNINKTKVKWILILLPTKYVSNGIIMCTNISFVGSDLGWMYCAIQIIISKMNSS